MCKPSLLRHSMLAFILMITLLVCGSCGVIHDKPAAEDLSLVLAGMDGSDAVTFEGTTALMLNGKAVPESELNYGGNVADHNKVSLYSLLPDGSHPNAAAAHSAVKNLQQSGTSAPAYYSRLEKKDGEWTMQSAASQDSSNPLPALNPLRQLEELESMEKTVTEEAGAARGTKVLRIELTSAEARKQLSSELEREMQGIRPSESDKALKAAEKPDKTTEAMTALWEQKNLELQQKIKQASIKAIYYLKVDTKRNLPKKLTLKRTVSYSGKTGVSTDETYITQVDFYGYR